ncbi:hypothetical protein [Amycolatopsis speibonae]|uniref:WXG100 family type VII secretion target n=1 Tax=Amycolatopsis speibonae TaxID=1450224 RepID=A0ABV7P360_9PSEU
MTGLDRNADGFIDLYPVETQGKLDELRTASTNLANAWKSAHDRIKAPGALFGGPMGIALKGVLETPSNEVSKIVDQMPGFYQGAADGGKKAVGYYLDGEAAATDALSS